MKKEKAKNRTKEQTNIKFRRIKSISLVIFLVLLFVCTNIASIFFKQEVTETTSVAAIDINYLAENELKTLNDYNLNRMVGIEGSEAGGYYFTFPEEKFKEILNRTLFEKDVSYGNLGTNNIDALVDFIKAELFTTLPNISKDPENVRTDGDKIQGAVKFKRRSFNKEIGEYEQEVFDDDITEADTSSHTIVIDAGHGSDENGQVTSNYSDIATSEEELNNGKAKYLEGSSGTDSEGNEYKEWELNQKVVDLVIQKLSDYPSINIIQTGKDVPDYQRLQLAKDAGAEAYISVHFNESDDNRGTEVLISPSVEKDESDTQDSEEPQPGDNSASEELGSILLDSISGQMNMGKATNKVVENSRQTESVLKTAEECGFPNVYVFGNCMETDVLDELMKDNEQGLDNYAQGIVNGILEYFEAKDNVSGTSGVNASETEKYLVYTSPENFDNMINNRDDNVLNYFTLDDDKNMIVATWTYSDSEGRIYTRSPANEYITKIQQYVMPYQYPLAFLIDTGAEAFSRQLAELSLNSDIIMTVFDNVTVTVDKTITTNITESRYKYWYEINTTRTNEEGESYTTTQKGGERWGDTTTDVGEPIPDPKPGREESEAFVQLTYADAWCVKYEKFFSSKRTDTGFIPVGEKQRTEGEWIAGPEIPGTPQQLSSNSVRIDYRQLHQRTIVEVENQTRVVKYIFYENPNREPILNGNVNKFVNLIRKYRGTALTNIESDYGQGLIGLLSSKESTSNMVELTKWLLQEASKKIYFGLVKYDFSEFDPDNFSNISGNAGGLTIFQEYLHSWENDVLWKYVNGEISYSSYVAKYVTEDKSQYISFTDGDGRVNFSYGIYYYNQNSGSYNNEALFENAGVSDLSQYAYIGAKLDVEIVDEVERQYIQNSLNYIKETTEAAGITLNEHEIQGLLPLCYQWGNNIITESFIDAYKQYGNTEELRQNFEHHGDYPFLSGDTTSGYEQEVRRGNANWKLFHEGIYTTSDGRILDPSNYSSGSTAGTGKIVEEAVAVHKYLRENGYYYAQAGIAVPNTSGRTIDCSSYTTWVLVNCGISGFTEGMYQWTSGDFTSNPQGWQEVSVSEAQPGDIVTYSGHVEIIAAVDSGDRFIVYNCGGDESIQSAFYNGIAEASLSGHSKSSVLKVLRVPN